METISPLAIWAAVCMLGEREASQRNSSGNPIGDILQCPAYCTSGQACLFSPYHDAGPCTFSPGGERRREVVAGLVPKMPRPPGTKPSCDVVIISSRSQIGGAIGAPQTESTVLWPFSKRDHLSPRTWPTGPHRYGGTEWDAQGGCGPEGLQNKPPPLSPSAHIPPSAASQQPAALPCNLHTNDSLSAECTLPERGEKERKQEEEERNVEKSTLILQPESC
ncbi:hypothetical protein EYF80_031691 [Liparis tanakae]|uniref:Uncharacterized protein n=1 Tax=Liparis tanakae TaxID=230148 RepID=A0A4Z2GZL7_9TELE|nr:hypothetical protein EYF80_031691 [Liparis tanakae]